MITEPRILELGDSAVTVEYGQGIDAAIHRRVMGLNAAVRAALSEGKLAGVIETVPTIRSLTVHYDALRLGHTEFLEQLRPLIATAGEFQLTGRCWEIPVCYENDFAPDMEAVCKQTGLTPESIVERHTSVNFTVYMLGFMPGFGFLGGLPASLALPRLANPRTRVPARSVAITGQLCAIYPRESPGGWRLIGRTPIEVFEAGRADSPCLLAPGDSVRFSPIPREEFDALRAEVEAGATPRQRLLAKERRA